MNVHYKTLSDMITTLLSIKDDQVEFRQPTVHKLRVGLRGICSRLWFGTFTEFNNLEETIRLAGTVDVELRRLLDDQPPLDYSNLNITLVQKAIHYGHHLMQLHPSKTSLESLSHVIENIRGLIIKYQGYLDVPGYLAREVVPRLISILKYEHNIFLKYYQEEYPKLSTLVNLSGLRYEGITLCREVEYIINSTPSLDQTEMIRGKVDDLKDYLARLPKDDDSLDVFTKSFIEIVEENISKALKDLQTRIQEIQALNPGHERQHTENPDKDVVSLPIQSMIATMAKDYQDSVERNSNVDVGDRRVPRWEHFDVKRRVVCAANRYGDFVVTGIRHHCPVMRQQIDLIGLNNLRHYAGDTGEEQGFVDQYGNYLTREEAMVIAQKRGQVTIGGTHDPKTLFSEDLY